MEYHVGVEDIEPNHWIAYVFDLLGCFSSAHTQSEAVQGITIAIRNHLDSRRVYDHSAMTLFDDQACEIKVDEVLIAYPAKEDPKYFVNAFFEDDLLPIDIPGTVRVLDWNRHDLFNLVKPLSVEILHRSADPRFGTIAGILKHIALAEQWFCSHLALTEDEYALPDDPFAALEVSRANTIARLPELVGSTRITELMSERWSPRKVIRRALWHERDHINHITQILASMK